MELEGTTVCNFMTTWGDGLFEVHRDLTERGDLVQIRVEMESTPVSSDPKEIDQAQLS
jgi:hypothetical protein